jgi:adenosylcobinamide-GDP ribazoletransferase
MALPAGLLFAAIIASAAAGRWGAVLAMALIPPVAQSRGFAKDIGTHVGIADLLRASLMLAPCTAALYLTLPWAGALAIGAQLLALIWLRALLMRRIGGVTGDCLGFFVYLSQLIWLLAVLAGVT